MPPVILVAFALPDEARPFQAQGPRRHVDVVVSGIGRANAERALRAALARRRPDLVLTCGFAGGLDPALRLNTVLFEANESFPLAEALRKTGARPGRFYGSDRVAITAADKRSLRWQTNADAVEMESAAIHTLCNAESIPCATVRVISDTANEDLPLDFNEMTDPDQNLQFRKLLTGILRRPGKIPALLRLQTQTQEAARHLAQTLAAVVEAVPASGPAVTGSPLGGR
jgi:nucleoside phosphorylase